MKKKRSVTYLLSCEEDPDLLVDKVTDCFMDLTHQEVREFSVFSFQHANVVWRVDNAIAGDFLLEFPSMISVESIEEVCDDLLMLSLHLHFVELSNHNSVVVGGLKINRLISYKIFHLQCSPSNA